MLDDLPPEVEALRRVPFFEGLTSADLQRLARIGERRSYAPGEAILIRGDDQPGLVVLLSGAASVEAGGTTHALCSGSFVGEMALLLGKRRSATVTATEPVDAMVVRTMYFRAFLIENPSVAVTILEGVAERLWEVQERVERQGEARARLRNDNP